MKFRPEQARWFEVYVPRNETVYTLEALARTGAVQLDQDVIGATRLDTRRIRQALARFDRLARRFADDLPEGEVSPARVLESPEDAAEQAVACLRTWCARLLVGGRRLRDVLKEKQQLEFLDELLVAMADDSRQVPALGQPTGLLCKCLYACTRGAGPGEVPEGVVTERVQGSDHDFFMMAGLPDSRAEVEQFVAVGDCREVTVPEWLPDDLSEQRREVRDRLSSLALRAGALQGELDAHRRDRKLLEALSNVAILRWYLEYAGMLTRDHSACHVTGWTSAGDSAVLEDALRKAHVNAVVLFPEAPAGKQAPARTSLAGWATPFRVFVEAMGAPGEHEIDPTPLLALVVPLLFGFMFPDIGHGIVLAATGLLLSRRYTAARLLVPCGLAAAIFGALFGEVFGIPGAMPALLGSPLEHPLGLIAASL
ncbi:MAG: V-type ATPase 116kDa subunit family protein, partial [Pseudomonadota bacterium]